MSPTSYDDEHSWAYPEHVYQAIGLISSQLEISIEHAFSELQFRSMVAGKDLIDFADDLVAGRIRFSRQDRDVP